MVTLDNNKEFREERERYFERLSFSGYFSRTDLDSVSDLHFVLVVLMQAVQGQDQLRCVDVEGDCNIIGQRRVEHLLRGNKYINQT